MPSRSAVFGPRYSLGMRWDEDHESPDLIDKRGETYRGGGSGFAGGNTLLSLLPFLIRTPYGWVIILAFIGYGAFESFAGRNLSSSQTNAQQSGEHSSSPTDKDARFVGFVLDDVQASWQSAFAARGKPYTHAKLVLFRGATPTGCGTGESATGPFYCPEDERVYIDLSFNRELEDRLGARGEFAKAYVIAHEIGHHVQHLLGIDARAGHAAGASGGSVRLELQADCYAGIWAHTTPQRDILEQGDIESALGAAKAIGDDTLQKEGNGRVRPETFTHGTSEQRVRWFKKGYEAGKLELCDTFAAPAL
jgi:predicted metalloprotease